MIYFSFVGDIMNYGFIKVASATPDIKIGDCEYNAKNIIQDIKSADKNNASLVVFPELSICGYTCGDLFYYDVLLKSCEKALGDIIEATEDLEIVSIIGVPVSVDNKLYNCGAVVCKGELLGLVPQINVLKNSCFLSGEEICKEINYAGFETNIGAGIFCCSSIKNFNIAVEIGNDSLTFNDLDNATIIAKLSCSECVPEKREFKENLYKVKSGKMICGYVVSDVGIGESTTDNVYSGRNMILENFEILAKGELFENSIIYGEIDLESLAFQRRKENLFDNTECYFETSEFELEEKEFEITREFSKLPFLPANEIEISNRCKEILNIQSVGLATRLSNIHSDKVVIGISGGLDSTLALIVCVKTFDMLKIDRKNIYAVTMPCFGTTKRTKSNAEKICEEYGVSFQEVNISDSVTQHLKDIDHNINALDVTYENSQARERTQVLMDLANKYGALVVGTGDLSELALGWATYNGDHMSMYGVNATVPKTLVRYLVKYEAENSKETLKKLLCDILDTPVSPELLPPTKDGEIAQVTEDVVGPYELHDFFIYYMLNCGYSPKKLYLLAQRIFKNEYSSEVIKKCLGMFVRRFFTQQFKRNCLPDGPKVTTVSLSPRGAFSMPSDFNCNLWIKEIENL